MSFFINEAVAQSNTAPPGPGGGFQIVFLIGLFVIFYFLAIRPQRKRQKEHNEMVAALSKGDEVVTTAGILGKVTNLNEEYVTLNVASNVELKFQKASVHAVLPKGTIKKIE